MQALITDFELNERLIAERRATGADRYDEVWEGVYVMAPLANNEHQILATSISSVITAALNFDNSIRVMTGTNVSDRNNDWTENYRCPDVAVCLSDSKAQDRRTHWLGGPDFAVEIVSQHDKSRDKFDFYSKVGTHELLIVDRYPWVLELYRLEAGALALVGTSTLENANVLPSQVLPLSWQLVPGKARPLIAVTHSDGEQKWAI